MTRWLAGIGASSLLVLTSATPAGAVPGPRNDQWWFKAWEIQTKAWPITQGSGVTVAVIDDGVNGQLPDLRGAVVPGTNTVTGNGNGQIGNTSVLEDSHGTAMAALIAAQGAGSGYVGVAPQAKIMPILSDYRSWDKAIRYAADNGAKVINMSQGFSVGNQCRAETQQAIAYALERDVVVVASAGNTGDQANRPEEPANCAGVLAVGAVDNQKTPWTSTQRQPYVAVAAPGFPVNSLRADGQVVDRLAGTSQAAALTSGAVALVRSKFPQMPAREVVQRVIGTAKDAGPPGKDNMTGNGVVIPAAALTAQVPKNAPNPVFAAYDQWKQANPNAVQGGQQGGQAAEKKDVPPSEQTKAADSADRNTIILVSVVGAVVLVVALVLFFVLRKNKKKAPPMGPGPGGGFGPPGGQQGPPPGWGGQQPPAPQGGPQGGPQYMPPQPPMQPQGGQPQGPPPQGPGGPHGGPYPPQ
ncbi:S8 family serine peptidase [Spirillospora sp. NPDC052242]